MINLSRREFLLLTIAAPLTAMKNSYGKVITVSGIVSAYKLGKTLTHEHVLVDFIGADQIRESRWDKVEVVELVAPFFAEAKAYGVKTIVECTPAFLGRDARLLKMLSDKTGMYIVTNTGYYGAVNNKYLPPWAFTETAEQLAQRWTDDFEYGIDGTNVRPGFIKIGVDARAEGLSDLHKKLVKAAGLTHLKTGLTIYSHTGAAQAAFEQLDILRGLKVAPSAFVWVHAQAEKDKTQYARAARMGAWVSLDGITGEFDDYATTIAQLKNEDLLKKILISHDAGYFRPGEKDGGAFKGYTDIFKELIPRLSIKGFDKKDLKWLLVQNPHNALALEIRRLK